MGKFIADNSLSSSDVPAFNPIQQTIQRTLEVHARNSGEKIITCVDQQPNLMQFNLVTS